MKKREYLRSPLDGKVTAILGRTGEVVRHGDALLEITQPCGHDVVFNGLCSICGMDMTRVDQSGIDASRANINMSHDAKGLRVSYEEANRLESETMHRLWKAKKLSLIIDLDQTIIHAFASQDPSFEKWLIENYHGPNSSASEPPTALPDDIGAFVLPDGPHRYYIKLRPNLREFLEKVSDMYEMHIYTMGTRHYAEAVAATIDPGHRYFKERILSRDESGSVTHKTLRRLFPCDTSMVVALDDRADVWQWSPNLIKVQPYAFFSGVGDINSGMLPPTTPIPRAGPDTDDNGKEMDTDQPEGRPEPTLSDNDHELTHMLKVLTQLHQNYYAKLKPSLSPPLPDVTTLLPRMKNSVLKGITLVFSAVIPIHPGAPPPEKSDLWRWAEQFGARCETDVSKRTTHMVAGKRDTAKVHKARRLKNSKSGNMRKHPPIVVTVAWLLDSMSQWTRLDETQYLWYEEDKDIVDARNKQLEEGNGEPSDESSVDDDDDSGSDPQKAKLAASTTEQPPDSVIESMSSFIVPADNDPASDPAALSSASSRSRKRKSEDTLGDQKKPMPAALQRLKAQSARDDDFSGNTTDLEEEIEKQEANFRIRESEVEDYLHHLDWDDVERELDEFMNESDSDSERPRTPAGNSHSNSGVNLRQVAMKQAMRQRIGSKDGAEALDEAQVDSSDAFGDSSTDESEKGSQDHGAKHRMKRRRTQHKAADTEADGDASSSPRHRMSSLALDAEPGNANGAVNEDGDDDESEEMEEVTSLSSRQRLARSLGMSSKPKKSILDDYRDSRMGEGQEKGEYDEDGIDASLFEGAEEGYREDDEGEADEDDEEDEDWGEDDEEDDENFDDLINELEEGISAD
ncbi:CTD phosphatase Fcp1 [Linderina pennispora]|nr:CTD phosphatase Fcp1 [Linderina pennispora]